MNPATFLARVEAACAGAVERTFALAFPVALEPVQIARKLVSNFESTADGSGRGGRRFVVRLSASDFARLERDRPYLERQWRTMLGRLAERSGRRERAPDVRAQLDRGIATGTVTIAVELLPEPDGLALRVRSGVPPNARVPIAGTLVVGRSSACDLTLVDARISRRHLRIDAHERDVRFTDLGSSNGTLHNGRAAANGRLDVGDVLLLGDTELIVEADDAP